MLKQASKPIEVVPAFKRLILPFSLIVGLIVLDAVVKILIRQYVPLGHSLTVIPNFFYITFVENPGAAFGILNGNLTLFLVMNFIAMPLVIAFIVWKNKSHPLLLSSLALIVAGGLGNVIDRLAYDGCVTDMFEIRYFGHEILGSKYFPIFNVADICLTVGVVLILCYFLFVYYDKKDPQAVAKHDRKLREKAEKRAEKRAEKDAKRVMSVDAWLAEQAADAGVSAATDDAQNVLLSKEAEDTAIRTDRLAEATDLHAEDEK